MLYSMSKCHTTSLLCLAVLVSYAEVTSAAPYGTVGWPRSHPLTQRRGSVVLSQHREASLPMPRVRRRSRYNLFDKEAQKERFAYVSSPELVEKYGIILSNRFPVRARRHPVARDAGAPTALESGGRWPVSSKRFTAVPLKGLIKRFAREMNRQFRKRFVALPLNGFADHVSSGIGSYLDKRVIEIGKGIRDAPVNVLGQIYDSLPGSRLSKRFRAIPMTGIKKRFAMVFLNPMHNPHGDEPVTAFGKKTKTVPALRLMKRAELWSRPLLGERIVQELDKETNSGDAVVVRSSPLATLPLDPSRKRFSALPIFGFMEKRGFRLPRADPESEGSEASSVAFSQLGNDGALNLVSGTAIRNVHNQASVPI